MVTLDILSDPICPWCYIGKAQLDRALSEAGRDPFLRRWHPFQLNPAMPPGGMERRAYLEAKFGGRAGAIAAYAPIEAAARAAGLALDLGRIRITPNTMDAHRLIGWAAAEGRAEAVVERLFAAYFVEGRDIGDPDELVAIAVGTGMDGAVVARLLAGEADRDRVAAADRRWRDLGVGGVPCHILAGRHVLSGAQPPEIWRRVIDDLTRVDAEEER